MNEDKFDRVCSISIAVITVMAALMAYFQTDASHRDDRANRDSKRYALEAFGLKVRGESKAKFAYHQAFKTYYELHRLSYHAEQMEEDTTSGIYGEAAEALTSHTRLFKDYYDTETSEVNIAKFEADSFVRRVAELEQNFQAASAVKAAWDTKATTYIVHLTLLAVALFLIGQATTLKGDFTKKTLFGTSVGLTLITTLWFLSIFLVPVPDLRDTGAIQFFANGKALEHQGLTKEANAEYDLAIQKAPDYLDAYLERGLGYLTLEDYGKAGEDFLKAYQLNPRNAMVCANLSEAYYEQGRFKESIDFAQRSVQLAPNVLENRGMLALTTLASSDLEKAKSYYQEIRKLAATEVETARKKGDQPPSFIWENLDIMSIDLEELARVAKEGDGTPPKDKLTNPEVLTKTAHQLQAQIDSLSVSLEYNGKPPEGELLGEFGEIDFGLPKYDDDNELLPEIQEFPDDIFPNGTGEVVVQFPHGKVPNGKDLVMRVFLDDEELPSWRMVDKWTYGDGDGETDYWYKVLSPGYSSSAELEAGVYEVEFFFDGHLAQKDYFTIAEEE